MKNLMNKTKDQLYSKLIGICALFFLLANVIPATATILRVSNGTGVTAPYSTVTAAHTAASENNIDTIYVEAGYYPESVYISKRVVIIGTGFFLASNEMTQANKTGTHINFVQFNVGSEYALIMGVKTHIRVNADHVQVLRNNLHNHAGWSIEVNSNHVVIQSNHITSNAQRGIMNYGDTTMIYNNIISAPNQPIHMTTSSTGVRIVHNVIIGSVNEAYNAVVMNNILVSGSWITNPLYYNTVQAYNMCNGDQFASELPDNGNNILGINMSTVFVMEGSIGEYYRLKTDPDESPAIDAGMFGVDMGAFGGNTPYVLSGMPPVPSIFEMNTGLTETDGSVQLDVNVQTKSNQ